MSNAPCVYVSVFFLCLAVTILGKSVVQTPSDLLMKQAESAEIECSHKVQNYYVVQWYKQSQSIMDLQLMGYRNIEQDGIETEFNDKIKMKGDGRNNVTLIIHTLTLTDSAVYFCAAYGGESQPAYFGSGTKLTVLDPKIKVSEEQDLNVTIIKPSEKESCKKTVTLVCVAKDFYPDHVSITWMVGGKPRTEGVATDPNAFREQETEHFTISSRLKVPRKEWNNEKTEFKCTLKFYDGKDYLYKENKVNGIAGSGYTREDYVKSSQMIKLSYGVFIAKSALYGLVIFVYVWRKGSGK